MKLNEAIARIDKLKSNPYDRSEKCRWLSCLDGLVWQQTRVIHRQAAGEDFKPYTEESADDTLLLVPAPYDEIYLWWLAAQIDYHNGEFTRYNNAIALFNTGFSTYVDLYHRSCRQPETGNAFHSGGAV